MSPSCACVPPSCVYLSPYARGVCRHRVCAAVVSVPLSCTCCHPHALECRHRSCVFVASCAWCELGETVVLRATLRLVCREAGVPWSRHLGWVRSRKVKLSSGPDRLCLIGAESEKERVRLVARPRQVVPHWGRQGKTNFGRGRGLLAHFFVRATLGPSLVRTRKSQNEPTLCVAQGSCASLGPAKDRKSQNEPK